MLDIFTSSLPVEPVNDDDEPEYYGDEYIVEGRMPPAKALEIFVARMFSLRETLNLSDSIYIHTNKTSQADE